MIELYDDEIIYMIRKNNQEALDILFSRYDSTIKNILKDFKTSFTLLGIDFEDLFDYGRRVLIYAVEEYDYTRSAFYPFFRLILTRKLSTLYKNESIKNEMFQQKYVFEEALMDVEENFYDCKSTLKRVDYLSFLDFFDDKPLYKGVLKMWTEGYTYEEIALYYNISFKRTCNIVFMAINKLKKMFK